MPIVRRPLPAVPPTEEQLERHRIAAHERLHAEALARLTASGWFEHQPDNISRFKCRMCQGHLDKIPTCTYCDDHGNMTRAQWYSFGTLRAEDPHFLHRMQVAEKLGIVLTRSDGKTDEQAYREKDQKWRLAYAKGTASSAERHGPVNGPDVRGQETVSRPKARPHLPKVRHVS